jgi:nucleoside-diphosphate-sugar epimerase
MKSVCVVGGAGYVGAKLVPRLIEEGHLVTVLDTYTYGEVFEELARPPILWQYHGDVRDQKVVKQTLEGADVVIHLACISNDPTCDLDPSYARAVNVESFRPFCQAVKVAGIKRFIYASSSSVYGVQSGQVTEDAPFKPLTEYARHKVECEGILRDEGIEALTFRPATISGYSPRQRLDLIVNILTNYAVNKGFIRVEGGSQLRPCIHIDDMVDAYLFGVETNVTGAFNIAHENYNVWELAEIVRSVVGNVDIQAVPGNDPRSYNISGEKIKALGFRCERTIEESVRELKAAFNKGLLPNSFTDSRYFNIQRMKELAHGRTHAGI